MIHPRIKGVTRELACALGDYELSAECVTKRDEPDIDLGGVIGDLNPGLKQIRNPNLEAAAGARIHAILHPTSYLGRRARDGRCQQRCCAQEDTRMH